MNSFIKEMAEKVRWAWWQARGLHVMIVANCVTGILRVGVGLLFVWVSKMIIDAATHGGGQDADGDLVRLSVWLASLLLVETGLSLLFQYMTDLNGARMKNSLRRRAYMNVLYSRWYDARRMHSGDLLNRLTEDVRVVTDVMCVNLPSVVVTLIQLCGAFALLYYMSWQLALLVVLIMPVFLALSKYYIKRTRAVTAEIRSHDSRIQSSMQEGIQHHMVVQTLECEPQMSSGLDELQTSLYSHTMHRARIGIYSRGMVRMGFIACYLTAFLWSVWHLHSGAITFGMMTAFLQLVARIQNPMANLVQYVPSFVHAITSVDRLSELEAFPSRGVAKSVKLASPVGIRVDNIAFRYGKEDRWIFNGFSHDFAPGSRTVIMGETGIGKSTLVKLMLGLLVPDKGNIFLFDRRRSVAVGQDTLGNMVYVPQGNSLLDGTVRSNLLLADPDATDQELREALHTAVADFVYSLPAGLDTPCGELGTSLSEGQCQRIAIARALLRKGGVLLLDEFNSSLDEHTANLLMERLTARCGDCTIIFISHRPEVVEFTGGQVLRLE